MTLNQQPVAHPFHAGFFNVCGHQTVALLQQCLLFLHCLHMFNKVTPCSSADRSTSNSQQSCRDFHSSSRPQNISTSAKLYTIHNNRHNCIFCSPVYIKQPAVLQGLASFAAAAKQQQR
jgi:hypothetical protein